MLWSFLHSYGHLFTHFFLSYLKRLLVSSADSEHFILIVSPSPFFFPYKFHFLPKKMLNDLAIPNS